MALQIGIEEVSNKSGNGDIERDGASISNACPVFRFSRKYEYRRE